MNSLEKWLLGVPGELREAEISCLPPCVSSRNYIIRLFSRDPQPEFIQKRIFVASGYGASLSAAVEDALGEIRGSFEGAPI